MREGIIESISLEETYSPKFDRCIVCMDDFSSYTIFGDYKELLVYLEKEVEFEVRKDIINGVITEVISTIAIKDIVQVVEDKESITDIDLPSLIPYDANNINVITFDKNTLRKDDVALAQIILVCDCNSGKSKVAKWKDFTCLDKNSQVFNLRLFTNDNNIDNFSKEVIGKYVMVDIKNTPYGFQVFNEMSIYEHEIQLPKEVVIALDKLKKIADSDLELKEYIRKYDLFDKLKNTIYFEPGYHLVEMMAECILIDAMCHIFGSYDRKLLRRMVFASRGYLLGSITKLSNPLLNYHRVITSSLKEDYELIKMLDITSGVEDGDSNKAGYLAIRKLVTNIMLERRGLREKNKINDALNDIDAEYSGLFSRGLVILD